MKKLLLLILSLFALITLAGCKPKQNNPEVTTASYLAYDIAKTIAGDKLQVEFILTPGVEVHSASISAQAIETIQNSQLFIYTSDAIDTWAKNLKVNNGLKYNLGSLFVGANEVHHHDAPEHDHEHLEDAIHYWTSTQNFLEMINVIKALIANLDPEHNEFYLANAQTLITNVQALDTKLKNIISEAQANGIPTEIYYAGHNAMGAFAHEYGITIHNLVENFKPDAESTAKNLEAFVNKIVSATSHPKVLFIEELTPHKTAQTIINEVNQKDNAINLEIAKLYSMHNISQTDFDNHVGWLDLFNRNLTNLAKNWGVSLHD